VQLFQQRVVESGSDSPGVYKRSIHPIGELKRTEMRATALRLREADDDEVACALRLDLEPNLPIATSVT